jgi:hypothetical protein
MKRCPEAVPSISINVSIVNKYFLNCLFFLFLINIPAEAKVRVDFMQTQLRAFETDQVEGAFDAATVLTGAE